MLFTKLDVSMQYYTFDKLDKESLDHCTIITPFGNHKYLRLPIGLKCSLDIAQVAMDSVLSDIKDADVYIDDVGDFSNDWDHHVNLFRIPHMPPAGSLKVLHAPARRGGI
jgi:hypothetical protein